MKAQKLKLVMAVALLGSALASADTLKCTKDGQRSFFTIQENQPIKGQATLVDASGGKSILQFTEERKDLSTRVSFDILVEKQFFHPYYELNISGLSLSQPGIYTGFFVSEGNLSKPITCVSAGN